MTDVAAPPAGAGPGTMSFPWWVALLRGIALLVVGGYLLAYPARTTVFLIAVLGWYWLFSGIFTIGSLFVERSQWGWRLAGGLLSIVAGGYIIAAPYIGAVLVVGTVTLLLGINGMIIGVIDIVKAFKGAGWGIGFLGLFSLHHRRGDRVQLHDVYDRASLGLRLLRDHRRHRGHRRLFPDQEGAGRLA